MTMLLFVNKPMTLLLFLLGIGVIAFLSYLDGSYSMLFLFNFVWLIGAYIFFATTAFPCYFLLSGNEKFEIKNVDINIFKVYLKLYWFASFIGLLVAIYIYNTTYALVLSGMFLTFYYGILGALLKCVIYAKFVSVALKKNPNIKTFKFENLYLDIREILLKKVIN